MYRFDDKFIWLNHFTQPKAAEKTHHKQKKQWRTEHKTDENDIRTGLATNEDVDVRKKNAKGRAVNHQLFPAYKKMKMKMNW